MKATLLGFVTQTKMKGHIRLRILLFTTMCVFGFQVCVSKLRLVPFFFFFSRVLVYCGYCSVNSNRKCWLSAVNSAHMHCLRTHKFHFFINFFIKNGSHITIHIFKNYFATVFSVFSFQFQQNKFIQTLFTYSLTFF